MKKKLLLLIITFSSLMLFASQTIELGFSNNLELTSNNRSGFTANFAFEKINYEDANTDRGVFSNLSIAGYTHTTELGEPKLPAIRKIIEVPLGAKVSANLINYTVKEKVLGAHKIIPAQAPVSKLANTQDIEFVINEATYSKRSFNESPIVRVEELGIMRGTRLFTLIYEPIKYNPASNSIKIYNDVSISVEFSDADYEQTAYHKAKNYSPYFEGAYRKSVFNYSSDRDEMTNYPVSYIIIADPMFETQLAPFIEWKIEKGFNVITAYTDEIGSTNVEIKAFLQYLYDNATAKNPAPSFILFVGDVLQIPAYDGSITKISPFSHKTDLDYVKLDGTDFLPEMYYGRFSANNTSELQPQIDKILEYEKFEMPDPSYLGEVVMIAGVEDKYDLAAINGNGAINYGIQNYFNSEHDIESHTYFYPASGSSDAEIISDVANGVGYLNYSAHGAHDSWSDPYFGISNINALGNIHQYPFVVGNCCLTNKFEEQTCFGEAWLRAEDQGAIGYIGGTNVTFWDEDYWWAVGAGPIKADSVYYEQTGIGVYDGLFHEHNEPFSDWFTTAGQMILNGNFAVVEAGSHLTDYYWEIYSLMGDPSLSAYIGVPSENNVNYPATINPGVNSINILADPYSYISLTRDGKIHGTVLADETGSAILNFKAFIIPGNAKLVITAQNREPVIELIEVVQSEESYVVIENYEINGEATFGQSFSLDINFRNVGVKAATGLTATLTANDEYVTISDAKFDFGIIAPNATVSFSDVFGIDVSDEIPNLHDVEFTVSITGAELEYTGSLNILMSAPKFEIGEMRIADSGKDGFLEAGETATVTIPIINAGEASSKVISAKLTTSTPNLISIVSTIFDMDALNGGETGVAIFEIIVADDAEKGSIGSLDITINSGKYAANSTYSSSIGLIFDDFKTGDFSSFAWAQGANGWEIDSDAYEGSYSMKSSDIDDSQTASISITMDVEKDGEIIFWKKISSENNYDKLCFYVNDTKMGEWSGCDSWSEENFDVAAGQVTFTWAYEKDGFFSSDDDCAWIDMIFFPDGGILLEAPIFSINTNDIDFGDIAVNETVTEVFTISNLGKAELVGNIIVTKAFDVSAEAFAIAAGESFDVTVTFAPTKKFKYYGELTIRSNDANSPDVSVKLAGTGNEMHATDLIPRVTELKGNYPNPFNPTTTIRYALSSDENVSIDIYNIRGQKVCSLVDAVKEAGYHTAVWSGKDNSSKQVASGIYFYKFQAGKTITMKKMILMK